MKKQLIHQDTNLLLEICTDLSQYLPILNEVKKSYENLELDEFSNEIFKEIISNGTNRINIKFLENFENQLKRLQITSVVLKENLLNGSDLLFKEFESNVSTLKRFRPETFSRLKYLKLNFISYSNNKFYLSEENKEQILENECRIYLENEIETELYNNIESFLESFEKLNESLNSLGFSYTYNQGNGLIGIRNVFLKANEGENKYSIVPESIRHATSYKEKTLKYNS